MVTITNKEFFLIYSELTDDHYYSYYIFKGSIRQCFEQYWYKVNKLLNLNTDDLKELIKLANKVPGAKMDYFKFTFEYTINNEVKKLGYEIQLDPWDNKEEILNYYYGRNNY